ncbi:hypothetical protein FAZ19_09930 [Sphingobacterium alkalisoli]|uniref:Lipoprotein n=1 Tax=Sphingobacterium alkalisoli TaxID=1874115 RepID=A0A4U0H1L3_9SPHI|nr:hypothetical protein [Sphingobacterium alkalisoli]TJY65453.1 hypothetical protein FAZ19_09930 [Sphingobacterium alkalisoli]GGH20371.1 hypothetical protein GCM10011418_25510 [Sphingobacterium alkalisoli]
MKQFLPVLILLLLLTGCSKEQQDEDVYGYEVECDHCSISYLDANERYVSIQDQRKHWRIEFRNTVIFDLHVTANTLSANDGLMHVHILRNGSRLTTQSGNSSVTTRYNAPSSGSTEQPSTSTLCGAPTQKGGPCQRKVSGGGRCWQHK